MSPKPVVRHVAQAQRFAADIDGAEAYITYSKRDERTLDLNHTFVPPGRRGRGIASHLTAEALSFAREGGFRIVPSCPFVAAYIERHREYRDLLAD